MTRVTLTYSISEAQFMHASRALWAYRAIGERGNFIAAILCLAAGPLLLTYGQPIGWAFIAMAPFFIGLTLLRRFLWRRAYRRMAKYTAPITAVFEPDQITTHSAEGDSQLPWSFFKSYVETPEFFYLFGPKRSLSILPKSALQDDLALEDMRDMITAARLPRTKMRWT